MTIAIHINCSDNIKHQDTIHFKCFSKIAADNPDHHFIFIFDSPPDPELYLDENCTPVILKQALTNNLARIYWYNYKVPRVLEKYNADIFITSGICSLRTQVKQIIIIDSKDSTTPQRTIQSAFMKKAELVFITDPGLRREVISKYKLRGNCKGLYVIDMIRTDEEGRSHVKERLFSGTDFIAADLRTASKPEAITVLKSFSIFKKWQKSDMKLALLGSASHSESIKKELSLYKYRTDVVYLDQPGDITAVIPAAFILVMIKQNNEFYKNINLALTNGVPMILSKVTDRDEILQDVAQYVTPDPAGISEIIMLLYKNEHVKNNLALKGYTIAEKYSLNNISMELWNTVKATVTPETT